MSDAAGAAHRVASSVLATSVVLIVVNSTLVASGALSSSDRRLWYWFSGGVGPSEFRLIESLTLVGVVTHSERKLDVIVGCSLVLLAGTLAIRGRPFVGGCLVVCALGALATSSLLKALIYRPDKPLTPWTPIGHTFPSGTAAVFTAVFTLLIYLAMWRPSGLAKALTILVCLVSTCAFALSALTYHFPTEVGGGILIGLAWSSLLVGSFTGTLKSEMQFDGWKTA